MQLPVVSGSFGYLEVGDIHKKLRIEVVDTHKKERDSGEDIVKICKLRRLQLKSFAWEIWVSSIRDCGCPDSEYTENMDVPFPR